MATFLPAAAATARPPSQPRVPAAADFHPIVLPPAPNPVPTFALDTAAAAQPGLGETIADFARATSPQTTRPTPHAAAVARALTKARPRPVARATRRPVSTGHHVAGPATWYCKTGISSCRAGYPGGLYAAAGPALRVGAWHGRTVRVCAGGTCISVKLIDWCACGNGHLIDLYSDAFRLLAPLSSGAVHVTVSW